VSRRHALIHELYASPPVPETQEPALDEDLMMRHMRSILPNSWLDVVLFVLAPHDPRQTRQLHATADHTTEIWGLHDRQANALNATLVFFLIAGFFSGCLCQVQGPPTPGRRPPNDWPRLGMGATWRRGA
jgi:hypothetical protein